MLCCGIEWSDVGRITKRTSKAFTHPIQKAEKAYYSEIFYRCFPHPQMPWLNPGDLPTKWSLRRRWYITLIICVQSFSISFSASAFSVGEPQIASALSVSSQAVKLGITAFTLPVAVVPLILAPLSESYGRRVLYMVTWSLYSASFFLTGFSPSFSAFLIGRALLGTFGSVSSTVVGGSLADIWTKEQRSLPLALLSFSALLGTASGPLTMGYVVKRVGWRWVEYSQLIFNGLMLLVIFLTIPETRHEVLIRRSNPANDEEDRPKMKLKQRTGLLVRTVSRPLFLLLTEPIVGMLSLWISFAWGVLYLFLGTLRQITQGIYNFDIGQSGLFFSSLASGFSIGLLLWIYLDKYQLQHSQHNAMSPENKFLLASAGGWCFPIGLLWVGLTSTEGIPWESPAFGTVCSSVGIYTFYLAILQYLSELYDIHTSSALAAQSFLRNLFSAGFPLFGTAFFDHLGPPKMFGILFAIAAILSTFPVGVRIWGSALRERSRYARNAEL